MSSASFRLAEPAKILNRLSSLKRPVRLRSGFGLPGAACSWVTLPTSFCEAGIVKTLDSPFTRTSQAGLLWLFRLIVGPRSLCRDRNRKKLAGRLGVEPRQSAPKALD